jgi:hypothetical protein
VFIRAALLHEIGHRVIVWWSHGLCDIPATFPMSGEAGHYIENCFFGGVTEGWWTTGNVGKFEDLCEVGMESNVGSQILGSYCKLIFCLTMINKQITVH